MRRTVVTTIAAVAAATMLLAGCGGVDREGTKKQIVDGLAGQGLTDAQVTCVANSIDGFTDDELKQLDSETASEELKTKFQETVMECATAE